MYRNFTDEWQNSVDPDQMLAQTYTVCSVCPSSWGKYGNGLSQFLILRTFKFRNTAQENFNRISADTTMISIYKFELIELRNRREHIAWPCHQGYKTFFSCSAHQSCSAQLSMKFSLLVHVNMKMPTIVGIFIFISREINVHAQLCLARTNLQILVIWHLLVGQISCSAKLSMKKVL